MAVLPPQPAGGPFRLTINGAGKETVLDDVWIGEVWVASGQSNMQWVVKDARDAESEIDAARYPGIRVLTSARPDDNIRAFLQLVNG